jgi:hypothetical protein
MTGGTVKRNFQGEGECCLAYAGLQMQFFSHTENMWKERVLILYANCVLIHCISKGLYDDYGNRSQI